MTQGKPLRIGFLIHDVSRLRRTVMDRALKPLGITRSQWWVLANLSRGGADGLRQTELAQYLDVGKVTLGGLVDRLEAGGYAQRRSVATDRRAKRVQITPRGRALLREIQTVAEQVNTKILAPVRPAERHLVEDCLARMKTQLHTLLAQD